MRNIPSPEIKVANITRWFYYFEWCWNISITIDNISANNLDARWALVEKMGKCIENLMQYPHFCQMLPVQNDEIIKQLSEATILFHQKFNMGY